MEPEVSLPCSRDPSSGPYSEHPVYTFRPYISEIHSNIIFPSMPQYSEYSLSFTFSTKILYEFFTYMAYDQDSFLCVYRLDRKSYRCGYCLHQVVMEAMKSTCQLLANQEHFRNVLTEIHKIPTDRLKK